MNKIIIASLAGLFITTTSHAELSTTVTPVQTNNVTTNNVEVATPNDQAKMICLIEGNPSNTDYKVIKRIKAGKGTYGSVVDLYPTISTIATRYKADAVINYNGSQRFGFWPWRIVRPVITGTAVKFNSPIDCQQLNGKLI
ncbi:hypothetical protein A6M14_00985 [Acinetobacter sp. Ac_877]|uniref:hypothetical protein n=1 Tax=Acinetobacter portensis TaxID=1839785 RepID=UPI00128B300F|nr:hypothetical protein [Acinetobacter portensis]MPW41601.1 hypothetical protein [Acinetobacter portensis]